MKRNFQAVPQANIPRSMFNLSNEHTTTMDADYLVPILCEDILPGDSWNVDTNFLVRLASPTLTPLLDNAYVDTFAFFTPYRLIWENFEKFHGAQDNPGDSTDFTIPINSGTGTIGHGDLADYFRLPIGYSADQMEVSALPIRAYRLIWNEWFRDQNLQNSVSVDTDNGPDTSNGFASVPLKRGKRHDYFTSCLPWPQKNSTGNSVEIPLGTSAPVHTAVGNPTGVSIYSDADAAWKLIHTSGSSAYVSSTSSTSGLQLYANLTDATGATINDLRLAFQTQKLLERDARGGTRYVELLMSHFGVSSPDFRLQRPEYLGGGSTPLRITLTAQQTANPTTPDLQDSKGAMAGIGAASGSHGWTKSFTEHGVLIILANIRADIKYQQGIPRYWKKQTRFDFFYPSLAQIGEQAVMGYEIYFDNSANDDLAFGYQERYGEYRYIQSAITGKLRSTVGSPLDTYHLAEEFSTRPTLSSSFIEANATQGIDRAISVPSEPQFICDWYFDIKAARPMPLFGVPGNLDRF